MPGEEKEVLIGAWWRLLSCFTTFRLEERENSASMVPMEKMPLLVNTKARSEREGVFKNWLKANSGYFDIIEPDSPESMGKFVREFSEAGVPAVAVAGGDGTLSIAANSLIGSETALAVMPSGTMNVFAREIGIGSGNYDAALLAIMGKKIREVDLFTVNGKPFIQMAGVGMDARSIELTTWEMKKKWNSFAYVIAGIKAAMEKQPSLTITTDDGTVHDGRLLLMGNGRRYGGPLRVFRDADNSDGLLDIVIFKKGTLGIIKDCLIGFLNGGFDSDMPGNIVYMKVKSCSVASGSPIPFELDGDLYGYTPVQVELAPKPLKVFVP